MGARKDVEQIVMSLFMALLHENFAYAGKLDDMRPSSKKGMNVVMSYVKQLDSIWRVSLLAD